ncbi:hypothetical protein F2Q69_00031903 [Brassica cretica]|uniref:ADP/ATP translocase n=1 Tax=Brassica cretica TaxID=69181 RepID=A0A8S9RX86_BRACR|nr:hypothetical protein F2Q69_00031903 [Brassica cretica]
MMGVAAAIVAKSAAAPIERVKLLLQNQGEMIKTGHLTRPYTDLGNFFVRIFREEGVLSFWRGNQANIIRYFPTQASNFAFKGYFKTRLGCSKEKDGYLKWSNRWPRERLDECDGEEDWTFADDGNLSCGDCNRSAAGATTSLFLYHLDYARARLGTDAKECSVSGKRHIKGMVDVYRKTLSSDGVKGFYRGFGVSILGITLYRGMYFGMYDTIKPIVLAVSLEGNFLASFLLGWSITTFVGVIAYPFDTVRRRMMLTSGQPVKYMNAIHALREIMKYEGFSALYKGVTANVLLSVAGAGVLVGYDHLHRIAYKHWLQ